MTPGIVGESDLSGNLTSEYMFFGSERIARKDFPSNAVSYYFSDRLKSASVISDSDGNIKAESDFYPWGGELQFSSNDSNHYKFTGKERDTETGLDNFGARYFGNSVGRFITPDWSAKPQGVPYAVLNDPQSLNLYSYVRNNPLTWTDPSGHYEVNASGCSGRNQAKCQKKYDNAAARFEKQRQKDLQSKDPRVRAAAGAFGDPNKNNGVHVGFEKLNGLDGKVVVPLGSNGIQNDAHQPIDVQVTLDIDRSSKGFLETIAHEGTHVSDDLKFLTSYNWGIGRYDSNLNITHGQTETSAFQAGAAITREHGFGPNDVAAIQQFLQTDPHYAPTYNTPLFPTNDPAYPQ